jgi:hypothetical protein
VTERGEISTLASYPNAVVLTAAGTLEIR